MDAVDEHLDWRAKDDEILEALRKDDNNWQVGTMDDETMDIRAMMGNLRGLERFYEEHGDLLGRRAAEALLRRMVCSVELTMVPAHNDLDDIVPQLRLKPKT